jgi:hypothetical protein
VLCGGHAPDGTSWSALQRKSRGRSRKRGQSTPRGAADPGRL